MARIDSYPTGTPAATDRVPYVSDPTGTPALKLAQVSALSGSGSGATTNPWALLSSPTGMVRADEFNGTGGLTWTSVVPAVGGGHATWGVGNDVRSVSFGAQNANVLAYALTPHALAVGESVETAVSYAGSRFVATVGLVVTSGTADGANGIYGGMYCADTGLEFTLLRSGTLENMNGGGINVFQSVTNYGGRPMRHRFTRVTATTVAYNVSLDGVSWTSLGISDMNWMPTPTHVGLAVSAWGSATGTWGDLIACFDYLRVY